MRGRPGHRKGSAFAGWVSETRLPGPAGSARAGTGGPHTALRRAGPEQLGSLAVPRPRTSGDRGAAETATAAAERGRRVLQRRAGEGATPPTRPRRPGTARPRPRAAPIGQPGSTPRAHWPAERRGTRPPWRASVGGPRAGGRRGHGGRGAAGSRSALAAVRGPPRAAGRLVLALLPWLRPPGPRCPLPGRAALRALPGTRPRFRGRRAPMGSVPGPAEAGARWVTRD